jgi:hypothetical protein
VLAKFLPKRGFVLQRAMKRRKIKRYSGVARLKRKRQLPAGARLLAQKGRRRLARPDIAIFAGLPPRKADQAFVKK